MGERRRITIAILALGGQGGGVLADWILATGRTNGYLTQGTSVPGVAQRTGTTVYYIEFHREGPGGAEPLLALTPIPGDVDIVLASELMEGGRAILRGFVTERTTLISSTHRIFAISEKAAMGDGRGKGARILEAARERAGRFVGFDMNEVAETTGSMISSVMFGALAGSGALPFAAADFEAAIRAGGKAVEANLRGFSAGMGATQLPVALPTVAGIEQPQPTQARGREVAARVAAELPALARPLALEGVRRLMDYQDAAYADLFLDRLKRIAAFDDGTDGHRLTRETARYLALWMSYEDIVRVADLKTRGSRFARVRDEVKATPQQVLDMTEYMHPRLEELCEMLPAGIGRALLDSPRLRKALQPLFRTGRHVTTTHVGWFLLLHVLAAARPLRRGSLRFREEQTRIDHWLSLLVRTVTRDAAAARELAECPRLLKGYSDTAARGLANYQRIITWFETFGDQSGTALKIAQLREAALADEKGEALAVAFRQFS
jgi:indolepyruvate ferredoxin oxidoreductase beta subunit